MSEPARFGDFRDSPDELEARSRRYASEAIIILPLQSGRFAVLNRSYEVCGFISSGASIEGCRAIWRPPATAEVKRRPTLEELGL